MQAGAAGGELQRLQPPSRRPTRTSPTATTNSRCGRSTRRERAVGCHRLRAGRSTTRSPTRRRPDTSIATKPSRPKRQLRPPASPTPPASLGSTFECSSTAAAFTRLSERGGITYSRPAAQVSTPSRCGRSTASGNVDPSPAGYTFNVALPRPLRAPGQAGSPPRRPAPVALPVVGTPATRGRVGRQTPSSPATPSPAAGHHRQEPARIVSGEHSTRLIGRRSAVALIGALALWLLAAQPALGDVPRDDDPRGLSRARPRIPNSEYVELQMWSPGQNLGRRPSDHRVYDKTGAPWRMATFAHDVAGDAKQSTLVAATPGSRSGIRDRRGRGDAPWPARPRPAAPSAGKASTASPGAASPAPTPSPTGAPASPGGIPDGMALRRTIEPGCPTLLEPGDDRDNSATDFAAGLPRPAAELGQPVRARLLGTGHGGGRRSGRRHQRYGQERPQTRIRSGPGHSIRDRTPTFRFASSVAGVDLSLQARQRPIQALSLPLHHPQAPPRPSRLQGQSTRSRRYGRPFAGELRLHGRKAELGRQRQSA